MLKRYLVFIKRFIKGLKLKILFTGTSNFSIPHLFWINGNENLLEFPSEHDLKYDFINIILDDEYGIKKLNSIKTVVDIGANIGLFSLMASNYFPDAKIHAYEPNPKLTNILRNNLKKYKCEVFDSAVGLNSGEVILEVGSESRMSSIVMDKTNHGFLVNQISFREVVDKIRGNIDLLKLDCEGAEWDILNDEKSFNSIRNLRMEYHLISHYTVKDLLAKTANLGFKLIKIEENINFGIAWFEK